MVKPIQILIADNGNKLPTEIIQGLENREYSTTFAENRKEVMDFCLENFPTLTLIDLSGDIFSGLGLISEIKAKSPHTEIIVCVDGQDTAKVTDAFKIGASNYIIKPLHGDLLFAILKKAIEQYQISQTCREIEITPPSREVIQERWEKDELNARRIIEGSPMGMHIYRLEPDRRLIFVDSNPAADRILGIENEKYIGKTIEEAFPSLAETEIPDRYRKVAALGEAWYNRRVTYNHEVIDGAVEVFAFQTQPGNLVVFFSDVRDQIKAEAEINRRAQQLTSINEMGQIATSSLDLDQVLSNVVNVVPDLVGAEGVSLLFLEDDEFVFAAASGDLSESLRNLRMPSNTGVAGKVLMTGQPVLVRDDADRKQIYSGIDDKSGYQTESLIAVPLILGGEVVGVMEAVHSETKAFNAGDLNLLETAAAWTAIALGNAHQHHALERQLHESQALAAISQALNQTLDLDRILDLIADLARQIIPKVERAVIHMLDEDQDLLSAIAVSSVFYMDKTYLSMRAGVGVAGQVMEQGQTINIGDTREDSRFIPGKGKGAKYLRSLMVAPVQSGDRRIGTISVSSGAPHAFSTTDENLLAILGVQAALAIETARLFEETHQRAHYLEMLNNMTSTALQIPDLDTILQSLVEQLVLLFQSDSCYLYLWDEDIGLVLIHTSYDPGIEPDDFSQPEYGEQTMTESVLKAGTVLIVEDVFNTPSLSPKIAGMFPARSLMGLPLIADDQKIGVALVGFNSPHTFTPEEINLAEQIAQQVTLVIAKAKLLESEQRRRQEAETLREVATTITSTLEIDRVLEHILTNLEQVIPYDSAGVILDLVDHLSVVACRGFGDQENVLEKQLPVDSPLYAEIWDGKTAIIIDDAQEDPRWENHMDLSNIRGWIGTPLLVKEQVIGYLTIHNHQPGAYGEPEAALAQVFANQAAVAIQNARLYDSTRQRLKEVKTLYTINNQIVTSIDFQVDEITQQIVNTLWAEFGFYHVHIYLFDERRRTLTVQQGSGPIGAKMAVEGHQLTMDEGVVGYVAKVGEAFIANIPEAVHFYIPNPLLPDSSAELAVPLKASGRLLGVLDVHHCAPNKFTEDDLRFVQTVADQLAAGLEKAMLYAELQEALEKEKSIRAQLVQTEKLAAMGRLVASVAHELNNPLQAIQNALYLVKMEEELTLQAGEDLQVALDETTRMGNLIARLRDVYRPTSIEEQSPETLNILVDEVERLIGTHLRHNKVAFEFKPDLDLPKAMMNRDQIKQVILNLCLNAVETMPNGGKLVVETQYCAPESQVVFRVKDSGPGISPEVSSHIFEPFYTTKEKGTGLGLFISYEIVQNHGGDINVESVKGAGATFTFSLPIET